MATLIPHLNFSDGRAREALEFYRDVLDGQLAITTYGDVGMPADAPGSDRVVFGMVAAADGTSIAAYDVLGGEVPTMGGSARRENGATITDQSFFLALQVASLDEANGYWERLADGARIVEPLAASAWSPGFGMLTDRFGATWAITVRAG